MHERSEWAQGMQRTDSYWRPSGGYYYPAGAQGRSWTSNGRYHPHAYSKHSDHFGNQQGEQRSHAVRWRDYNNHREHNSYKGASHPLPMAPGHRRGKTGSRGGSRPFPSKRVERTSSSSLLIHSTGSPLKASSANSKPSSSSSSSSSTSSSSSSSRASSSFNADISRPDQECSKDYSLLHRKPHNVTKTKSDVPSELSQYSSSASKSSTHQSSVSPEARKGGHKSSSVAQSPSVSVSSSDLHKMKFVKLSESLDTTPIPSPTLVFCNSVPSFREILRRKPVVVLENLTEKLMKRKLKFAGLHFNGNYTQLISNKKTKRKAPHDRCNTGSMEDEDSSGRSFKVDRKCASVEEPSEDFSDDGGVDSSTPDHKLSEKSSLLVDPKVMSLSRPLQTAFSNNSSKTNMPFKNSGKGKTPSKMFSSKPSGPVPRHLQMFDLDKLRTKLKGANFGGSRKPRQILNQQQDFDNVMKHLSVDTKTDIPQSTANPLGAVNTYECTMSLADSTKEDLMSGASEHVNEVCVDEHKIDRLSDDELSKSLSFNVEVKENYKQIHVHENDECLQDSENSFSVCVSSDQGLDHDASQSILDTKEGDETLQSDGEFSTREGQEDITYDSVSSPSVTLSPPHLEAVSEEELGTGDGSKPESSPEKGTGHEPSFKEVTAVFESEDMDTLCKEGDRETDSDLFKDPIDGSEDEDKLVSGKDCKQFDEASMDHETQRKEECVASTVETAKRTDLLGDGDHQEKTDQFQDGKKDKVGSESADQFQDGKKDKVGSESAVLFQDGKKDKVCSESADRFQDDKKDKVGSQSADRFQDDKEYKVGSESAQVNEGECDGHSEHDMTQASNPRTLRDICQDFLHERTDLIGNVAFTVNDETSKSSVSDNVSTESNLKCLNETNSKTADTEDSSPVCIITSVESGAHIYFSEGKSDLNGVALRRKPTDSEEALCEDIKTEISDNTNSHVNNSPEPDSLNESVPVINGLPAFSTKAMTTVSSSLPGMSSPCINAQYSIREQGESSCDFPLENQAMNPVLLSPQENMQQFTSTSFSQQDYQPNDNSLPNTVLLVTQEDSAPLSLVPMTLPNVPCEYPSDNHRVDIDDQSANDPQGIISDENPQASGTDPDFVLSASEARETDSTSGEKVKSNDANIVANVCQGVQYSTEITKMVSDLDVMHYEDEEPPVLPKMSTDDAYASQNQESKFVYNDLNSETAEELKTGVDHCPGDELPKLLTPCKFEYLELEPEQPQDVCKHEGLLDEASIKKEPDQDRIEVGRLNLHRVQGDGSEDSDATLIYSCDEDNTCFEEIFQDSLSHSWPRSAPWTDTEETESPSRYEGKLVIVSDIADDGDGDGENTSDTNTSNERLSLIITTLRKDLEEKKSDRRQVERRPVEDEDNDEVAVKPTKEKGKRKTARSKRKRTSVKVPCLDAGPGAVKQQPKKTRFKKRENLIVTLQRKKSSKEATATKSSKGIGKKDSVTVIDTVRTNLKTKQKRKMKRRLTVRKRRKKVEKPEETSPLKEDSTLIKTEPKKIPNIRGKKKKLIGKIRRRKPKRQLNVEKEEPTEVTTEDPVNSDDSDELPTILPPKRRRLQSNGNSLVMMQNTIEKGSSSERIMLEFPRHNWLEQKINQLQQQTSCSPIPGDDLPSQTSPKQAGPKLESPKQEIPKQESPKQESPSQESPSQESPSQESPSQESPSQESQTQESSTQESPVEEGPQEEQCITIEKDNSDTDQAPKSPECAKNKEDDQGSPPAPSEELPESGRESSVPDPSKESFSLQEAMQLVGAEDSQDTLVIDESRFGGEDNVSIDKNVDKEPVVNTNPTEDTCSAEGDYPTTGESDPTTDTGGIGAPLDLCVRKNGKPQGVAARPKANPPVQMVFPQIQQPARPVSTDSHLMKETKDLVQNVLVVPEEDSTALPANVEDSQQAVSEALNLSKVVDAAPQCAPSTDFSEMIKGVVMPVVTSVESGSAQSNDNNSTSPPTETSPGASTGSGVLASTQSMMPTPLAIRTVDNPALSLPPHLEPPRHHECSVMQPGQSFVAPGLTQAPLPVPSVSVSQAQAHPRHGPLNRNVEGNALDKEFEKHLKEFRQLEMLAARKEREREALLHLKKRKAMLLKEMKFMKTQQSSDTDHPGNRLPLAHNEAQFAAFQGMRHHLDRPNFQNTQHHAQVAELRPFQPGSQTMAGPSHQTKHSRHTSSPMSHTHTSTSYDGSSHRKRPSDDRRPLVQMINLAMLQRGRKFRRLNDDQRGGVGGSSSGSIPTPAHQNKSDININPDADVPSSEITHCPYVKRKTPILEPPGSNRSIPPSAALVPAHSQQPFQTAGSLIVPARNGQDQNPPPPPPYPSGNHRLNMVSPSGQSQTYPRPSPTQGQHKNNLTDVHNETIARNPSDPNFSVHHVSHDQPMPYVGNSADRSVVNPNSNPNAFQNANPNPNLHQADHFGNATPQWPPNLQNQFSNNPRLPTQVSHAGMQPMRAPAPHGMNHYVQPSQPYGMRPDRNVDVIDLTKEQDTRKMMHCMAGEETGGTENSVQRELTAALARRQGLEQPPLTPRRKPEASTPTNYNTNSYGNQLTSQSVQNRGQSNAMYSPQTGGQQGNIMPPASANSQFHMPPRPGAVGNQYRMQEPTSVKSALLAHGSKMICPPSYPMNTSAATSTYTSAQYQQQRNMNGPQQMSSNSHPAEGYSPAADKNPMVPGMSHMQQVPPPYNEHLRAAGQYKNQQNWRPQVPTSVSNVQMSFDKQQQLMMITRKTQWEQFQQQKHAMAQKGLSTAPGNQHHEMHTAVSSMPQVPGPMYALTQAAPPVVADSMQQRAAMHQHSIRMMQRTPVPGPPQMQGKIQPPPAYSRDSAMMGPGQGAAPALIEFQQQEGQRRMQPMAVNQPLPRLHQFNGACVVCGALAMYLCSSCRMVWYCSQPCQNNHWKRHGAECKPVQKPGIPGQI